MAGTYTKKEFGAGPEEQTLLKDSNGTRIVPSKGNGVMVRRLSHPLSWLQGNAAFLEWFSCGFIFPPYSCPNQSAEEAFMLWT